MLKKMTIKNIALVEDETLDFNPGLTVLTGETGAGKSVIVNALALILGERADREYIRHGAESAEIEAVFDIGPMPPRYKKQFADYFTDNNRLEIKREISKDGNSKIRVKDNLSTLTRLKEIISPIAEIIGQHANQMLMNEDNHLLFLDYFGSLDNQREKLGEVFKEWDTVASELKRTVKRKEQLTNERELLLFQKEEIEKAQVHVGEDDELNLEKRKLDSALELMTAANTIREILDGEDNSVISNLRLARKELEDWPASIQRSKNCQPIWLN